jgi:hypothetical protein
VWGMALPALLALAATPHTDVEAARTLERGLIARRQAAEAAGYRVEAFLETPVPPERTRN